MRRYNKQPVWGVGRGMGKAGGWGEASPVCGGAGRMGLVMQGREWQPSRPVPVL